MSNMYKCNNCGIEYGDSLEAVVCCGEGSSMVNEARCGYCGKNHLNWSDADECCGTGGTMIDEEDDEPETNELGQEKWEEYVEEQLYEAEDHIERALRSCESRDQRGELTGLHRRIVGILFRYYDIVHEQNNE